MKFKVYKNGKADTSFKLAGAYMFGTDDVAIRRVEITCKDGVINCAKPSNETAGLSLLWTIEGYGSVQLSTTCLPEREKPYILNLELARAKLMQIVTKQQEWSLFADTNELEKSINQAKQLFIDAIDNISEPSKSAQLADKSLYKSTILSEKLTQRHSDKLFITKSKNHLFSRGCLGCKIEPKMLQNSAYGKAVLELFGFVTIPVNWAKIEKQRDEYDFTELDACIKTFSNKKVGIGAGPLLKFNTAYLPDWLIEEKPNFQKVLEYAYEFINQVVTRYSRFVRLWKVLGGLNCYNCFGFNFEQTLEMSRASVMAVRNSTERAIKLIELANPWGEYYAAKSATVPPIVYVDMLIQSGIGFDAFGLDLRFGKSPGCVKLRDMMNISSILDCFSGIAKPVHITEFSLESQSQKGKDSEQFGWWQEDWNPQTQAKWIQQFYKIALAKPFVDTVTYSSVADSRKNGESGLLDKNMKPKQAYESIKNTNKLIFKR